MSDDTNKVAIEQYRHECEVRSILAMKARSKNGEAEYMKNLKEKRPLAFPKIESDVNSQWKKGNRGEYGDWR